VGHRIAWLRTLQDSRGLGGRRWGRRFGSVSSMAPKISTEKLFRRLQKVVAAVDLPGVPAGTFGKVWFVSGVTWIRYHVAFENGAEIANVDGAEIADRKVWLAAQAVRDQEALEIERAERREAARAEALANLATGPAAH